MWSRKWFKRFCILKISFVLQQKDTLQCFYLFECLNDVGDKKKNTSTDCDKFAVENIRWLCITAKLKNSFFCTTDFIEHFSIFTVQNFHLKWKNERINKIFSTNFDWPRTTFLSVTKHLNTTTFSCKHHKTL